MGVRLTGTLIVPSTRQPNKTNLFFHLITMAKKILYDYGTKIDLGADFWEAMICQIKPRVGMLISSTGNYVSGIEFDLPISEEQLKDHVISTSKGLVTELPETFILSSYNHTTK